MKKNGFTLIELLAVIIILAVIALIATPIILNVIDDAKKSGDESNVAYYANAIELKLAESFMKNGGSYTTDPTELKTIIDSVETNGKKPTNCTVKVGSGIVALKDCETSTGKYSFIGKQTYTTTEPNTEFNTKWDAMTGIVAGGSGEVGLVGTKIGEKVLASFPNLALANTEAKGCATVNNNYSYMGGCYLSGAQTNNYIWFSGFLYRIMGINKDGSIRLITEENVTAIPYNVANNTNFTGSHAESWLNEYFISHLKGTDKIVESKFCQGAAVTSSPSRTDCTGGMEISKKVGLISIDEYNLSGASSSYLNTAQYFWTMSPYSATYAWSVNDYGYAYYYSVSDAIGLRVVINVNSNTTITSGNGTLSDHYVLNEDKTKNITGNLNEKASSGEYVKLANKVYRVVSKNTDGTTKLILDSYYQEIAGTNFTMNYGSNNTFTLDSGIGQKLNIGTSSVYEWLAPDATTKSKIKTDSKWYQNSFGNGIKYTEAIKENASPIIAKVGLINIGEILSGQSASITSKTNYWTLTPYTSVTNAWIVNSSGIAYNNSVSYTYGLRVVINVNSNTTITSGNGTLSSPYEI